MSDRSSSAPLRRSAARLGGAIGRAWRAAAHFTRCCLLRAHLLVAMCESWCTGRDEHPRAQRVRGVPAGWGEPWVSDADGADRVPGALDAGAAGAPPDRRTLVLDVWTLLHELGPAPGTVAARLSAAGVRARPGDTAVSPIARYLAAVAGADPRVTSVTCDPHCATVNCASGGAVRVTFPPAVTRFAEAFEHGCYPELLGRPARRTKGDAPDADRRVRPGPPRHRAGGRHGAGRSR